MKELWVYNRIIDSIVLSMSTLSDKSPGLLVMDILKINESFNLSIRKFLMMV